MGDGLLAEFPDKAEGAAYAVLGIHAAITRLN